MKEVLWRLIWPNPQQFPGGGPNGPFSKVLDPLRAPAGLDPYSHWPKNTVIPVRGELSPFAFSSSVSVGFVSEETVQRLAKLCPTIGVNEHREPIVCEEPDGSKVNFLVPQFSKEAFVDALLPLHCEPPFPEREDQEPAIRYYNRLARQMALDRTFALDAARVGGEPWVAEVFTRTVCNEAFRQAWKASETSLQIAAQGWNDIGFEPLAESIPYTLIGADAPPPKGFDRNGPKLHSIWFDTEMHEGGDEPRHEFPVDVDQLGEERSAEIIGLIFKPMPAWTAHDPIPALRPLRHLEPGYAAVSDDAFLALSEIAGETIGSAQEFLLKGSDGEVRTYHLLDHRSNKLQVDWSNTEPPLTDIDSTDEAAISKELSSRSSQTTLAIVLDDEPPNEFLYHQVLSRSLLVSDTFLDAWNASSVAKEVKSKGEPGLQTRPTSTYRVNYRWVDPA